jgi:hypothetical protein
MSSSFQIFQSVFCIQYSSLISVPQVPPISSSLVLQRENLKIIIIINTIIVIIIIIIIIL